MVTIRKHRIPDGFSYEIEDYPAYVRALQERGFDAPPVKYRVFISHENLSDFNHVVGDWESELKSFFQLSPATEIECQVVES